MGIDVIAFSLGGLLLLIGIVGGGFELKELKFPTVGKSLRLVTTTVGIVFIVLGISLNSSMKPHNGSPPNEQGSKPPSSTLSAGVVPIPSTQSQSVPTSSASAAMDPTASLKPTLISAIRLADNAEVEANYNLNPSPLHNAYTGEALRTELANLQTLKSNNVFISSTLESQDFLSFKVSPDGLEAEVRVVETWSTTQFSLSTGQCIGKTPSHKVPQTMFLKRTESGWLVDAVVQDLVTPDSIPCK